MSDLEKCPIIGADKTPDEIRKDGTVQITAFKHRSEPIIHQHDKNKTFQIYCESCLITTGFYKTEKEARKRWSDMSKQPIDIMDYRKLPFIKKFPDHKNGSMKDLK